MCLVSVFRTRVCKSVTRSNCAFIFFNFSKKQYSFHKSLSTCESLTWILMWFLTLVIYPVFYTHLTFIFCFVVFSCPIYKMRIGFSNLFQLKDDNNSNNNTVIECLWMFQALYLVLVFILATGLKLQGRYWPHFIDEVEEVVFF